MKDFQYAPPPKESEALTVNQQTLTDAQKAQVMENIGISSSVIGKSPIGIETNSNLNNYTNPGLYTCPSTSTVTSLTNCPVNRPFSMTVRVGTSGTYPVQELVERDTGNIFTRSKSADDWTSWVSLSDQIATFGFSSLNAEQTITSSYATYNLASGKSFNDWDMINVVAYRGNWVVGTAMVTVASFKNITGVQILTGWNGTSIEYDVKYTSATSFDAKYISTDTGTLKVRIYAMKLAV